MNKLLVALLAVCAGAIGFRALHRNVEETRRATVVTVEEWKAGTNALAATEEIAAALRRKVREKRKRLGEVMRRPNLSLELLALLEAEGFRKPSKAWAELRQQLDIGWESSPDYVLVSKQVLNQLDYQMFVSATRPTDLTCKLLALSREEKSALQSVLAQARAEWQTARVERTEPSGDILARYTVLPPEPASDQSLSNRFAADVTGVVGPQRAGLLLPQAWQELKSALGPAEAETLTIRRSEVDGEPDLICELRRGDNVSTAPVRYARYPSSWFLALFPGGWETVAEHEGFELPAKFQK